MHYDLVVLISIDTLRADAVGAHPDPAWRRDYRVPGMFETPTLDALAREGAYFPDCVSAAPYTSASHGALFSGRWPIANGLHEYIGGRLHAETVFARAKAAGYRTLFKTDFPLILGHRLGFTESIDTYIVEDNEAALALLRTDSPTFAFLHFADVHIPYGHATTQRDVDAFARQVEAMEAEHGMIAQPLIDQFVEAPMPEASYDLLMRYKSQIEQLYRRGDYDRLFRYYMEGVNRFDRGCFAKVIEAVRLAMRERRTLLVVFADHGEDYTPEAYGHFNSTTEGSLHVPLIFAGHGIEPRTIARRVRTIDMAPTLLELMGLPQGAMDGRSLAPLLYGDGNDADAGEDLAFAQTYTANSSDLARMQADLLARGESAMPATHFLTRECVYRSDYKYDRRLLRYVMDPAGDALTLASDPGETLRRFFPGTGWRNVRNDVVARDLASRLDAYNRSRSAEPTAHRSDEDVRRRMNALGYHL